MWTRRKIIKGAAQAAAPFLLPLPTQAAGYPADFNADKIRWASFSEGLSRASAEGKRIYLLIHADWCPTCRAFRQTFFDQRVVELSQNLVFVLVDKDLEPTVSRTHAPDGEYVPRSMILSQDGVLLPEFQSVFADFKYFLPVEEPDPLLGFLNDALRR